MTGGEIATTLAAPALAAAFGVAIGAAIPLLGGGSKDYVTSAAFQEFEKRMDERETSINSRLNAIDAALRDLALKHRTAQ